MPEPMRPVLRLLPLLLLSLTACAGGGGDAPRSRAELTNPALGLDYSAWLIGPIAAMATQDEIGTYLSLRSDAEATAFIDAFWQKRQPHANSSTNDALETYR